jgi:hypothetical protein
MKFNHVKPGNHYVFTPNLMDIFDPKTSLTKGDIVTVVELKGCPKANTMGHCHVEKNGVFQGLVHVNSLQAVEDEVEEFANG